MTARSDGTGSPGRNFSDPQILTIARDYQLLNDDDPVRQIVAERLLPSRRDSGPLLVTPVRHYELVKALREVLEHGRAWLADNHAADVHLLEMDVPPYPERDDTASDLEGRSQDALPEQVFLQLKGERNLALLPAGNRRNCVELAMRVGRRPWELRHLEFDCLEWHDIDVEDPDGTVRRRSYPFLAYWMQKVRRRHKLPLHPSDAEVITRQQDHLRHESPHWFHEDGRPRSTRMVLFSTPRRSRANALGERPYDSSTIGYWLETWLDQFAVTDEHGKPFDPARVFPTPSGTPTPSSAPTPASRSTSCKSSWPTRTPPPHRSTTGPRTRGGWKRCAPSPPSTSSTSPAAGSAPAPPTTTLPTGSARASARCPSPRDAATR